MLNKKEIKKLIEEHKLIEGYFSLDKQLTPNGFDLTVEKVFEFDGAGSLDFSNKERELPQTKEIIPSKKNPDDKFGWWHLGKGAVETGIKNGNIEIAPFETMRGRSFTDAFVILDEAQNVTPHEIKMFLTRIGQNCTVILNGDIFQSDLSETSGLSKAIHMVKKYMLPVPVIEFQAEDIVRSDLCKQWIIAFMKEGT